MALQQHGILSMALAAAVLPACANAADPTAKDLNPKADALTITAGGELMSDYIYRGVSLSARRPSAASSIDIDWRGLYVGVNAQSVKLPTQPAAEITLSGGLRHSIDGYDFDLGLNYFYYPGEVTSGTTIKGNWEAALGVTREMQPVTLKGLIAYSPESSDTSGSIYAEGRITVDLPQMNLPKDLSWQLDVGGGYWRFGKNPSTQPGLAAPSYANWHASVLFWYTDNVSFEFGYYDTSLSKEDCFVLTGDSMAVPGAASNPLHNPNSMRSGLCGATLLGRLSFSFEPLKH